MAELKRHAHANSVDRYSIRVLLDHVFVPCACLRLNNLRKDSAERDFIREHADNEKDDDVNRDSEAKDEYDQLLDNDSGDFKVICPGHSVTFPIGMLFKIIILITIFLYFG